MNRILLTVMTLAALSLGGPHHATATGRFDIGGGVIAPVADDGVGYDLFGCDWSRCGQSSPIFVCDRSPIPRRPTADLVRLAADPRHSTGLADVQLINADNDGLDDGRRSTEVRPPSRAETYPKVADVVPRVPPAASQVTNEYHFPMSRCDDCWLGPWCDCPLYEEPWYDEPSADTAARAAGSDQAAEPSATLATLRPLALLASRLLGGLGEQMLAYSRALEPTSQVSPVEDSPKSSPENEREPLWQAAWPEGNSGL